MAAKLAPARGAPYRTPTVLPEDELALKDTLEAVRVGYVRIAQRARIETEYSAKVSKVLSEMTFIDTFPFRRRKFIFWRDYHRVWSGGMLQTYSAGVYREAFWTEEVFQLFLLSVRKHYEQA